MRELLSDYRTGASKSNNGNMKLLQLLLPTCPECAHLSVILIGNGCGGQGAAIS
jgi:hypothetical protein